ncbi:MAG: DNA-formamidopyrimidine glycosylase family protein [Dehalococcoidia bacterium]
MPEIPDLEAIRGFLNQRLPGERIERAEFLIPVVFRVPKDEFVSTLEGNTFGETRRLGKFLLFDLESGHLLVINAMLAGRFQYLQPDVKRRARTCMALGLANGWELRYADDRVMGKIYLVPADNLMDVPQFSDMGPDALEVSEAEFTQRIRRFTGQIKSALVNYRFIAGIGNAYADEILFVARLHPYRKRTTLKADDIARLYEAIQKVFAWATPIVAEQMRDELNYDERRDFLKVHRRGGEPCPVCGTRISEITAGQRITNFCRNCQPGP